jgi:hypothetical protein
LLGEQNKKVKLLGETTATIYRNQVDLSQSHTRLDEQFAVLTRLTVMTLNDLIIRLGGEDLVTYDGINAMFQEWNDFRSRPDFREHMSVWMMGGDLSALPPPPEPAKEEEQPADAPEENPEGAVEFGGDYESESGIGDEKPTEGASKDEARGASAEVQQVQDTHQATA